MFYVTSEIYLNNDLGSLAVSVDNYPQKRKNHLTITYIDLLLVVIDIFVNSSQTDCVLVLPSFTIMENLLWPEMSFNLTEFLDTNFSFVVVAIKTVTSIYLVMAFVQLCEEKWNEVMMN